MTKKGTTAPHEICDNAEHPKDSPPKMVRLYYRVSKKFIPVGWYCPDCGTMQRYGAE
jgi:hypothetical protein